MLATVYTKALRDRWIGMTVGAVSMALFLLYGMSVYRSIDLTIYTDLPEAFRQLFGIADLTDAGRLAYDAVYGFAGALTLGGLAISIGGASIAGEERDGTIGLLLGNPKSRTHVLASKAGALVTLTAAGAAVMWLAGLAVPQLLDVDVTGMQPGALVLHMWASALFYGFLAMVLGAWTGNRTVAAGTAAAVMVVSYLAVGILPLVEGLADLARVFPWYYLNASQPVANGPDAAHLAVLLGTSAVFAALAVAGVNRRDLRERSEPVTILDRLRRNPLTRRATERLAGSARVSAIWVKAVSEHQGLATITALVLLSLGVMLGPMYSLLDQDLITFSEQLPDALLAMVGFADMGTPEGWYQTEHFSVMGPIAAIAITVIIGARGLAGEERSRTMGLLLASPVSRSRVVREKAAAMGVHAAVVGFVMWLSTMLGSVLGGLGMSPLDVAAASLLLTLLGLVFGGVALTLSAATGRVKVAVYGSSVLALGLFLVNSLLQLNASIAGWARWSPFYYYLTSDPLREGLRWSHAAVLAGLAAAMVALAVWAFEHRDLRQTG